MFDASDLGTCLPVPQRFCCSSPSFSPGINTGSLARRSGACDCEYVAIVTTVAMTVHLWWLLVRCIYPETPARGSAGDSQRRPCALFLKGFFARKGPVCAEEERSAEHCEGNQIP